MEKVQAAPSSSVEAKVRRAIKKLALPLKQKLIKYKKMILLKQQKRLKGGSMCHITQCRVLNRHH